MRSPIRPVSDVQAVRAWDYLGIVICEVTSNEATYVFAPALLVFTVPGPRNILVVRRTLEAEGIAVFYELFPRDKARKVLIESAFLLPNVILNSALQCLLLRFF